MNLLNCLGLGTVTSTKETNTDEIMVYLPGYFPQAEGRTTTGVEPKQEMVKDASGNEVSSNIMTSNAHPATWMNFSNNNRITSPDVREGSKVAIYNVTGSEKLYWSTVGVNAETFRLETVIYGYSANPNLKENTPFNVDNFYIFKVDTRDGIVTFRSSDMNEEKTRFDIQIHCKEGYISWVGDEKSILKFDDVNHSFTYTNAEGSIFNVDKKDITMYAPNNLNIRTDNQINISTSVMNIKANAINGEVPITTWKGNFKINGTIHTTGLIHSDTDVTSNVSLNEHRTTGVRSGSDISAGPI